MQTPEQQILLLQGQNKALVAQCEAAKGMVNEGLAVSLQLRTNLHLMQQALQENQVTIKTLQDEIAELKKPAQSVEQGMAPSEQVAITDGKPEEENVAA